MSGYLEHDQIYRLLYYRVYAFLSFLDSYITLQFLRTLNCITVNQTRMKLQVYLLNKEVQVCVEEFPYHRSRSLIKLKLTQLHTVKSERTNSISVLILVLIIHHYLLQLGYLFLVVLLYCPSSVFLSPTNTIKNSVL